MPGGREEAKSGGGAGGEAGVGGGGVRTGRGVAREDRSEAMKTLSLSKRE